MKAVVIGASGEVGKALMAQLIDDDRFAEVAAVVRSPLPGAPDASCRVEQRLNSFDDTSADGALARDLRGDVLFCALGTTTPKSGKQGLEAVDLHLVVRCAELALAAGVRRLVVVSSLGANPKALSHYSRVKGQMEQAVAALAFEAIHVVRPSLLLGERAESRPAESAGKLLMPLVNPLLPRRMRGIEPADVAVAMRELAVSGEAGACAHHLPLVLGDRECLDA